MNQNPLLDDLLTGLSAFPDQHCPDGPVYRLLKRSVRHEIETRFRAETDVECPFGPFGTLRFPYFRMGAIDSLNLFDIDELILFGFYWHNRARYHRAADLGANLGLHSILLNRCGFEVRAYEPDPMHFEQLQGNLRLNGCTRVRPVQAAISRSAGRMNFVRVLGNTTGSHLNGAKPAPYGELEHFPVQVEPLAPLLEWADLVKMDIEGHEAEVLRATKPEQWQNTDALIEIGSAANARAVFEHFQHSRVRFFAQKIGWGLVQELDHLPTSHREGSLFLTCKNEMPWDTAAQGPTHMTERNAQTCRTLAS
jgi:FkbM family methyltransferase